MAKPTKALKTLAVSNATDQLTEIVVKSLQEKKGHDITCLDLRELPGAVADMFVKYGLVNYYAMRLIKLYK